MYTDRICQMTAKCAVSHQTADTIYFGGGTPSLLGADKLCRMLDAVAARFSIDENAEITLEANPACVTLRDLIQLREHGFNRISFGVQSVDEDSLHLLGRGHSSSDALQSVLDAKQTGFENISVDLMLATPGQTADQIDRFIDLFGQAGVEHISAYLLKIEENTPFARQNIVAQCPDEDATTSLYLHTVGRMEQAGYPLYEISNFAHPGRESRHNLKYWNCQEYLGLGPSAHSFIDGRRRAFPRDLTAFLTSKDPFSLWEDQGPGGGLFEYAMLRLRLREGLTLAGMLQRGFCREDYSRILSQTSQIPPHLIDANEQFIRLTTEGFLLSNSIITRLLWDIDED